MIRHLYNKKNVKDHNGNNKTVVGNNVVVEDLLDASVSPLLADLVGPDPAMRERAREALVALGDAVVPALIQLLAHHKPHVRWEAAKALGGIAEPISATALVNALDDTDGDVRWVAAEALIALGRGGLPPLLARLLEPGQSRWLCEAARHICHALVKRRRLAPLLRPLLEAYDQFEPQVFVPLAAFTALSKLRELD